MTSDHPSHTRDLVIFMFGLLINGAFQQLPNIVRNEGTGSGVARISGGLDLYTLLKQPDQKEMLSSLQWRYDPIFNAIKHYTGC